MQNAGIANLGLNWRYLAFEVLPEELRQAIEGARAMRFVGLNLTLPHKLLAVKLVDVLDDSARTWGTVNTIRFEAQDSKGAWLPVSEVPDAAKIRAAGFNTDADAVTRSLKEDLEVSLPRSKVLLLGAGGAGRTAALKLASEGVADLCLVNRTSARAEAVALEVKQRYPSVKTTVGYPAGTVDLVLNATSLGLRADDPLPYSETNFALSRTKAVYDMIYLPSETRLLQQAKAAGCRVANGLGMLLYQGAKALEIWTGRPAPLAIMRRALEQHVYH
jgi:shikimate dehydrogenase